MGLQNDSYIGAVGGAVTSWTGVGAVLGGAAVVHGADVTSSGVPSNKDLMYL